jgi:FkbM family methyltransferase
MTTAGPMRLRLLGGALRTLPPHTRGKGRLARFLLSEKIRRKPITTEDRDGNCMVLPNLLEPIGLALWMNGIYEPDVMRFLKESISSTSVVIDVGANIGAFTLPLGRYVQTGGRVVAVEASPSIARILKLNVERNQLTNVIVVECAASTGKSPHIPFYEAPADHFGMGSSASQFGVAPIEVRAESLDHILDEHGLSTVDAIKVDVEGYEADVFRGAHDLLHSGHRPRIVFEFCDWAEERAFPGKRGWAQEILLGCGYRLWRLSDYLSARKPIAAPVRTGYDSLVAVPGELGAG